MTEYTTTSSLSNEILEIKRRLNAVEQRTREKKPTPVQTLQLTFKDEGGEYEGKLSDIADFGGKANTDDQVEKLVLRFGTNGAYGILDNGDCAEVHMVKGNDGKLHSTYDDLPS